MIELEVTDKPHKNDDLRIQQDQEFRDYEARFGPGYWVRRPRIRKYLELRQVGSRKPERWLGQQSLGYSSKTRIQRLGRSLYHNFQAVNPQTDLQREPGVCQHDVQAGRVGEPSHYPHRRHEVHG